MSEGQSAERSLASRVAAGDREACARLIEGHHEQVYRLLAGLCRDRHWAEDLTQETFAACWRKIGGFNGRASLGTWLRRIAYHKFIDWQRRRGREVTTTDGADPADVALGGMACEPAEKLLAEEALRSVHAAMDRLPPPGRDMIVMHYLEGLSHQEMAYVLDQPVGTVKWRVSTALAALRQLLPRET